MQVGGLAAILLAACGGNQVGVDAGADSSAACAVCVPDSGPLAPDLGTPAYDKWLSNMLASSPPTGRPRYAGCWTNGCNLVAVRFAEGKDCSEIYVFDRTTHGCLGSSRQCPAPPCMTQYPTPSDECPAPMDASAE